MPGTPGPDAPGPGAEAEADGKPGGRGKKKMHTEFEKLQVLDFVERLVAKGETSIEKRTMEFARKCGIRLGQGMTGRWSKAAKACKWRTVPLKYQKEWREVPNWFRQTTDNVQKLKGVRPYSFPTDILAEVDKLFVSRIAGVTAVTQINEPINGKTMKVTIQKVMGMWNKKAGRHAYIYIYIYIICVDKPVLITHLLFFVM